MTIRKEFLIIIVIVLILIIPRESIKATTGIRFIFSQIKDERAIIEENLVFWNKSYGGKEQELAEALKQTSDGGYALAGEIYTTIDYQTDYDFLLVKTDKNGILEWNQTFGTQEKDILHSLMLTKDGGFAITGLTKFNNTILLVKFDEFGNYLWSRSYIGEGFTTAYDAIETSDGGFILVGHTYNFFPKIMIIIKTNADGLVEWKQTFGHEIDIAYAVVETSDGGFAVAGESSSYEAAGSSEVCLIKISTTGDIKWYQMYGDYAGVNLKDMIQTSDGGFALFGSTSSFGEKNVDYYIVKTDQDGNRQWNKTFGSEKNEYGEALLQTSDEGYIMTGNSGDAWVVKTDALGNAIWNHSYEGHSSDIIQTIDGGFAMTGYTRIFDDSDCQFWLQKFPADFKEPEVDSPPDKKCYLGTEEKIEWKIGDKNPGKYEILKNNSIVKTEEWENGTISYYINNLPTGVHKYTLVVFDTGRNEKRDSVNVEILKFTTTTNTTLIFTLIIMIILIKKRRLN